MIVTTSEIRCFNRCQRLHYYKYVLGYRPTQREHALEFGSLVHTGLETWWATAGDLGRASQAMAKSHANSMLDGYDLVRADVMLAGYHARWVDEPIEVVAVEHEFCVPIQHPDGRQHLAVLGGKVDAVCRSKGSVYVPEHKTASAYDVGYMEQLRGDDQISNYLIALEHEGYAPGGALYDVLVKLPEHYRATPEENRRYRKDGALYAKQRAEDESPDEYRERLLSLIEQDPDAYYHRAIVGRTTEDLDEARLDMWHLANAIIHARTADYHPRSPKACRMYGRTCAFFEVCFGGAPLEDSTRFTKLDNTHQELSNAISDRAKAAK